MRSTSSVKRHTERLSRVEHLMGGGEDHVRRSEVRKNHAPDDLIRRSQMICGEDENGIGVMVADS